MAIQEYFVSAIQNIETLVRYGRKPTKGVRTTPLTSLLKAVRVCITYLAFFHGWPSGSHNPYVAENLSPLS
jgi:hypothetical protein